MRTVTLKSVLERAVGLDGVAVLTADDRAALGFLVNTWVRWGWLFHWWPEAMETDERAFRAEWEATDYEAGAEVYHAGAYWTALAGAAGAQEPGVAEEWTGLSDFAAYVAWTQAGETVIPPDGVRAVYREDPTVYERARRLNWRHHKLGVMVHGRVVPATVFLEFRREVPVFGLTPYDATEAVSTGSRRYVDSTGESYLALQDGTGNDPTTAPDYWEKVEFPEWLAAYVSQGVYADTLRGAGQTSKSLAETGYGESILEREVEIFEMAGAGRIPRRVGFYT